MTKQAVIIGVGASDGVGGALARRFGREGYRIFLAGRTKEKLDVIAKEVEDLGSEAVSVPTDVTDEGQVNNLIETVAKSGALDVICYNAGNNAVIPFEKLDAKTFEQFWRVCCFGGFLTAQAAMPILEEQGHGTFLFTGASGSMRGKPNFAHFASAKAGLRMLSQSLARSYGPKGIHVAHVVIDGAINGNQIKSRYPEYLDHLGEDGALDPEGIAEAYWNLHLQPRSVWTQEIDVRPFKETW